MLGKNRPDPVVIVGAGVGGLSLAARLGARGVKTLVLEKEAQVGGKMRALPAGEGCLIDAGPTVLTMRWVFDELFREVGADFGQRVALAPLEVLARHWWPGGATLDLHCDRDRSAAAVERSFGRREAEGYRRFSDHCASIYEAVREPFLRSPLPGLADMMSLEGLRQARALAGIDAARTMWSAVGSFFEDPRLKALFGRYATYVGSSPFEAPATLNVISAVEQAGAWVVKGGMAALGQALLSLARERGAEVRTGAGVTKILVEQGRASGVRLSSGEVIRASAVVTNGDVAHLASLVEPPKNRAFKPARRSLSALVLTGLFDVEGLPLDHHNVLFSGDYRREFDELFGQGVVPSDPTIYICAQDRGPWGRAGAGPERLLILVNAPPTGDAPGAFPAGEEIAWQSKIVASLRRRGLSLNPRATTLTSPRAFEALFPATGGALYGPASHGMTSAFARPASRTSLPGLYAVGGSAHPGAGVPMVALSARIAEKILLSDLGVTSTWPQGATPGGTSTASAPAGATA